jgi:hypothetical protein
MRGGRDLMTTAKPIAVGAHIFAGGFTVGMRDSFEVPLHLEASNYGVATAQHNLPGLAVRVDPAMRWGAEDLRGRVHVIYGNPPCFIPGTMITTVRGRVPIEAVVVGDIVLTHDGSWRQVEQVFTRPYVGCLVTLMVAYRPDAIKCTPEHPLLIRKLVSADDRNARVYRDAEWIPAANVCKGDLVLAPAAVSKALPPVLIVKIKRYIGGCGGGSACRMYERPNRMGIGGVPR